MNDDEVEAIIPSAAYALAKIHMHLVVSGYGLGLSNICADITCIFCRYYIDLCSLFRFCYTARGGFCYSEEDILEFRTGN